MLLNCGVGENSWESLGLRVPEKYLLLLYWLGQSLWLCGSQQTGKFLKRWDYQTTWPASWEICMQIKKQVRNGHGTTEWFQMGKGVCQGCMLSPCLFNLYAEYIMRNAWLDEAQAGIKIAARNINNLRYTDDTTLMAEYEGKLKSLLMKVKGVGCHFLLQGMKVKSESEVAQSCPTLRDPMDCSRPGSSIHGIFQARVLEWGAIAFSETVKKLT